jgi:hypothetical protein
MPETTSARRVRPALPLAVAGLLLSVLGPFGAVAPPAGAAPPERGSAPRGTASRPPCPKIIEPSVPPPAYAPAAFAEPGAPDGAVGSGSARLRRACDPPDFLVPQDPAPRRTSARRTGARTAAEPHLRPPRQHSPRKRAAPGRPARDRPAAGRPAAEPGRAGGYAAGLLPGAGSPQWLSYGRSLAYSGGLGLVLAAVGVAMVGRRRRGW